MHTDNNRTNNNTDTTTYNNQGVEDTTHRRHNHNRHAKGEGGRADQGGWLLCGAGWDGDLYCVLRCVVAGVLVLVVMCARAYV